MPKLIVILTVALDDVLSPATLPSHWCYHRRQVILRLIKHILYVGKTFIMKIDLIFIMSYTSFVSTYAVRLL